MRVRAEVRGGLRVWLRAAQGGAGVCGVVPGDGAGGCMPPASATAVRARVRVRVRG